MAEAATNLPCSPLGAPFHGEGTYLDYWPQQLAADPELIGAAYRAKSVAEGSEFVKNPTNFCSPEYVETLDRKFGPFNLMRDGLGVLLLGSTYLLQVNGRERVRARVVRAQTNPENIADAFLTLVDQQGDMESQRPTHSLLIAGEMACKAAWSTDDTELRDDLMQAGAVIFTRLHDDDHRATKTAIEAGQRLADIQLREISQQIRLSCRIGEDVRPLQIAAARIIEGQANDLLQMPRIRDYRVEGGGLGGHMFEQLGLNILRRAILLDPNISADHREVRIAYKSEDRPKEPDERKVDSAFDIVVLTVDSDGNVLDTDALQLKQGFGARERQRPYHPEIIPITAKDLTVPIMIDVAYAIRRMCKKGDFGGHAAAVDEVSHLFEPVLASAKAA